jgi:hypothetical protein
MGPVTVAFGLFLILVGLAGYFTSESQNPSTALIPAGFGLVLVLLGVLALKDRLRKHAMHAAAALGLLGFLGAAGMSVPKLLTLATGGDVERPRAVVAQTIMALTCALFVGLCVKSFIHARRARAKADPAAPA